MNPRRKRTIVVALVLSILGVACARGDRRVTVPTSLPSVSSPSASPSPSSSKSPTPKPSKPPTPTPKPSPSPQSTQTSTPRPPLPPPPTPPSGDVPPSLIGTQWSVLPTSQKVVALTFDAGANADGVPSILQTLAEKGVPGTFFLTGKWVEAYPEYAAQIGAKYPVANHSYSHPDLTKLSDQAVRDEITKAAAAIQAATGRDTHPIFRFPFGAADPRTISIVNSLGYGAIYWTVDTRGWQGTSGGQSADLIVQRVIDALRPGEIVIMHVGSNPNDGSTLDADALPRVIDELRSRGYSFVTIDQYL